MVNQYAGATVFISGATYLDTKTIIHAYEGFAWGATREYVNIGQYEVEKFDNSGPLRETLEIQATNKFDHLNAYSPIYSRAVNSYYTYYSTFGSNEVLGSEWQLASGTGSVSALGGMYIGGAQVTQQYVRLMTTPPLKNVHLNVKFRISNVAAEFLTIFRVRDEAVNEGFIRIDIRNNEYFLQEFTAAGVSTLSTGALPISRSANTDYWLDVNAINDRMTMRMSSDGIAYNSVFDYRYPSPYITIDRYGAVGVGLYNNLVGGATAIVSHFQVDEVGYAYTLADMIKYTYSLASIHTGVSIPTRFSGLSGWLRSAGSSFTTGTSNNVFVMNTAGSTDSWHTYIMPGRSLYNFVADIEVRGSSGMLPMVLVGATDNYYGHYWHANNPTNSGIANARGRSQYFYGALIPSPSIAENQFVKVRVLKQDSYLAWFMNGRLVNAFQGVSLSGSSLISIGVGSWINSTPGTTNEYRNFEISNLDQLYGSISLDPQSNVSSLLSRILPEGIVAVTGVTSVEIVNIGSSRGGATILNMNLVRNSTKETNNISGANLTYFRGKGGIGAIAETGNTRIFAQVDSSAVVNNNDGTIRSIEEIQRLADYAKYSANKDTERFSLDLASLPLAQIFDRITYTNPNLGISQVLILDSFSKDFDVNSGSFTTSLSLTNGPSSL